MKRHHPAEYTAKPETWKLIKSNWVLYLFLVPAFVYFGIFAYAPMYGVQIAFKNFVPSKGIWGSEWTGLTYFTMFLQNPKFWDYVRNTVYLSLYSLIAGFPVPIILALILNDIKNSKLKRISQTLTYMPHFISLVVVCGILRTFCSSGGIFNQIISVFNPSWTSPDLLGVADYYRTIHIGSSIWQECGWESIIYLATLSTIDPQLYEAAYMDGASKLQRILHITLPALIPIISIQLIMRVGRVITVNYEKILLLYNPLTYEKSDVISTYMYRYGLLNGKYSMGAAVGVFNSLLSVLILTTVNGVFRRTSENSLW